MVDSSSSNGDPSLAATGAFLNRCMVCRAESGRFGLCPSCSEAWRKSPEHARACRIQAEREQRDGRLARGFADWVNTARAERQNGGTP